MDIELNVINAVPWIISLVALLFSLKSFYVAKDAKQLSVQVYKGERSIILHSSPSEGELELNIKPIDSNHVLLSAVAFFPKQICEQELSIDAAGKMTSIGIIQPAVKKILESKVDCPKDAVAIGCMNLPLYIKSYYACKGETYTDVSLYIMDIESIYTVKNHSLSLSLGSLVFMKREPKRTGVDQGLLNSFMDGGDKSFLIPSKYPELNT